MDTNPNFGSLSATGLVVINLTQHKATPEQVAAGVVDPDQEDHDSIKDYLTFSDLPSNGETENRAANLALMAKMIAKEHNAHTCMIGGALWLMEPLQRHLKDAGLQPVYAFSKRASVEVRNPNGTVTKNTIFQHEGWVRP